MGQCVFAYTPFEGVQPQWHRGLSRYGDKITDWKPAFAMIAKDFAMIEMRMYDTQGKSGVAEGWKPLSDNPPGKGYRTWKMRHYPDKGILELTGAMRKASINPKVSMSKTTLTMTIQDRKAIWHQQGHASPTKLPARRVVSLTGEDRKRWFKFLQTWAVDATRAPWAGINRSQ